MAGSEDSTRRHKGTEDTEMGLVSRNGYAENELSKLIIGCAIEVHRTPGGPGLLEVAYEEAFCWELEQAGVCVERQLILPIHYKGMELKSPLRVDLLVDDLIVVECKAMEQVHAAQLLTYLRLSKTHLGLLVNFGAERVSEGITRVVNGYV